MIKKIENNSNKWLSGNNQRTLIYEDNISKYTLVETFMSKTEAALKVIELETHGINAVYQKENKYFRVYAKY